MRSHSRVLFPIFVVLALVLAGVEFTLRRGKPVTRETVVWEFSPSDVDSLRWGVGDSVNVVLVRRDGGWWVRVDSLLYPADPVRVRTLLDDFSVVKGVAWAQGELERYELDDSTALWVEVGGRSTLRVYVGKAGPTFDQSFVRRSGEDRVYLVRGNWKPRFIQNPTSWRRRKLFDADLEEVVAVRLGDRLEVVRDSLVGWRVNGQPADSQKTVLWLKRVLGLASFAFLDTLSRDSLGLDAPAYTLEVITRVDTQRLWVADRPVGPNRTYLGALREGDPSHYGLNRVHFQNNIWIAPDSLLASEGDTTQTESKASPEETAADPSHGS